MRIHTTETIQRAQLSETPLRLILSELWRRVLAWVDGRWPR